MDLFLSYESPPLITCIYVNSFRDCMMMDFIVKHRITLLYISMGLIVIQAYLQEEYAVMAYGVISSVVVLYLKRYKRLIEILNRWF
mgnify:CR=1 FL=1